jgi:branched-subunit amino acid transport protein
VTVLWITIVSVALASAAIRAIGPILLGDRELPSSANAVIALLVPAVLTALVVTETFGEDGRLVLDEKAIGVVVAAGALALRAPVLLAVALAVVATTLARTFG